MFTRSARILKAALDASADSVSDVAADVFVSELQPYTSYEFFISDTEFLQHENLTLKKPVLVDCCEEVSHSQDLVSDHNALSPIQPVEVTDIEGIPPSCELVNLEPVELIHFDKDIIEESELNLDSLEDLEAGEPGEPDRNVNELTKEHRSNIELLDGSQPGSSLKCDNGPAEEIHPNCGDMESLKPDNGGKRSVYVEKRKKADKNEWDRNKNKKLRMSGQQVADVKTFKYCPDGKISYKLSYEDEYVELPCRSNAGNSNNHTRLKLYDNRIKITEQKFQHLQELTSVLSQEVKDFYASLPYDSQDKKQGNKKTKQKTESDEESETNEEVVNIEETRIPTKATKLKSTTKYKNKVNKKAKQTLESDEKLEKKTETTSVRKKTAKQKKDKRQD